MALEADAVPFCECAGGVPHRVLPAKPVREWIRRGQEMNRLAAGTEKTGQGRYRKYAYVAVAQLVLVRLA